MRSFEERRAEVLVRSKAAIDKRKKIIKSVTEASAVFLLCITIFLGYRGISASFGNEKKGDGAKDTNISYVTSEEDNTAVPRPESSPALDAETEKAIKAQYAEYLKTVERHKDIAPSVSIDKYAGSYNGAVVVMLSCSCCGYDEGLWTDTVAGVEIQYYDGRSYSVYHNGNFYSLQEAYDNSLLNVSNLESIAKLRR